MEEVVPLVRLSRAEVAFEKVVLNMVHNHVVESVKSWWDSNEWTYYKIEQMLANRVIGILEKSSVLRIVHHEDESLQPKNDFLHVDCKPKPVGGLVPK